MENLYKKLSSESLLRKSFRSILKGKSSQSKETTGTDGISLKEYSRNKLQRLERLSKSILAGTYKTSTLKGFPKKKANKLKYRLLTVSTVDDRVVQKAILAIVAPLAFKRLNNGSSFCGVTENIFQKNSSPKYTIAEAVKRIISLVKKGNYYFIKGDISSFFDSINKEAALTKIQDILGEDRSLNKLFKEIIYSKILNKSELTGYPGLDFFPDELGVVQGSPLSPLIANAYLEDFDNEMIKTYGDSYIRYMDDFLILRPSAKDLALVKSKVKGLLHKESLSLEDSKTEVGTLKVSSFVFLGLHFSRQKISTKHTKQEVKTKFINEVLDYKRYKGRVAKDLVISVMNSRIRGWVEFLKRYHSINIFKNVNEVITNKKRYKAYNGLNTINLGVIEPLITEEEWRKLF